jgi:hypothetical protein
MNTININITVTPERVTNSELWQAYVNRALSFNPSISQADAEALADNELARVLELRSSKVQINPLADALANLKLS